MAEIEEANAKRTGVRRGAGNIFNASGRDGQPRGPLPTLSDRPTLLEFFEKRFAPANHVLQSATRALKTGMPEEIILACLIHDTVHTMMKVDHGWWGAQMYEPYVSEEATFAIRYHQTLRFYPDDKFGYEYPESYLRTFGEDYKPEPYLEQTYQMVQAEVVRRCLVSSRSTISTRSIPMPRCRSNRSSTSSAATSSSRKKGSATITARRRICGER